MGGSDRDIRLGTYACDFYLIYMLGGASGLYHFYGVPKYDLPAKMFGVFEHRVIRPSNPLVRGFDEVFYAPHSRHTGISREDVLNCKALRILAESDEPAPS